MTHIRIIARLIGYMEKAMDATTSMSTPPEEVDRLIQVISIIFSHIA